jgi:hypothetical protein
MGLGVGFEDAWLQAQKDGAFAAGNALKGCQQHVVNSVLP